jgi:magnesium-dependent phosphatase 1
MTKYDIPAKLPKCIVFDLDDTLWRLEVDSSWGPPFQYDGQKKVVIDKRGYPVPLFKDVLEIFALIHSFPQVKIAIASRTTTPDWAAQVLKLYSIPELGTLYNLCSAFEMYDESKTKHFRRIQRQTGIAFEDMLFFDDNPMNLCVEPLGVEVVMLDYEDGLTMDVFLEGLRRFSDRL